MRKQSVKSGKKILHEFCFQFVYTNNEAKYKALVHGLATAQKEGIKQFKVFDDSDLVVTQVRNISTTKNQRMRSYQHRVWDLIEYFKAFNIKVIP